MPNERFAIHYQSPKDDPHKVPRPHYVTVADGTVTGGEAGDGLEFVCIHPRKEPQPDDCLMLDELVELLHVEDSDAFWDWRAAFTHGNDFTTAFSVTHLIERIEMI